MHAVQPRQLSTADSARAPARAGRLQVHVRRAARHRLVRAELLLPLREHGVDPHDPGQRPELARLFIAENGLLVPPLIALMDSAVGFSRMLHGASAAAVGADTFYRAFVPELGSVLYPRQVELIKRCMKSENGMQDYVGATVFPGLVKVSNGPKGADGKSEMIQTVVRRAQVICACALAPRPTAPKPASEYSADSLN